MIRVDEAATEAYAKWADGTRVFRYKFRDNGRRRPWGFAYLPSWDDVDLPAELFEPGVEMRAWLTSPDGKTRPMSIWIGTDGHITTGRYPEPGDVMTIRW